MAFEEHFLLYLDWFPMPYSLGCPAFFGFDGLSMVEVEPSLLLYAILGHHILNPDIGFHDQHTLMVRSIDLAIFAQIHLLFPFDLSLVHTIIVHFPHSTECPGIGHLVVALVFLEVVADVGPCLVLALVAVFAPQARKGLLLVPPE